MMLLGEETSRRKEQQVRQGQALMAVRKCWSGGMERDGAKHQKVKSDR